ncbi:MAG TPA: AAA family ATPase [Nitrospira sp.]|nr:AAA family ATPase [Nitrospira sp.]
MANIPSSLPDRGSGEGAIRLRQFSVTGLFGRPLDHVIDFPDQALSTPKPQLLIIVGPNGSGKTTILRMIGGMISLDFNAFRIVPFSDAKLVLSNGDELIVKKLNDPEFPLEVMFRSSIAQLSKDKSGYSLEQQTKIDQFRSLAGPLLDSISYNLVDIHRSLALRVNITEPDEDTLFKSAYLDTFARTLSQIRSQRSTERPSSQLAQRVRGFIRDAQVNYRRFFGAEQLDLLPRILERLKVEKRPMSKDELSAKLETIRARMPAMKRLGLETDERDLQSLTEILGAKNQFADVASLAVLEAYVEMQENRSKTRELIADRLTGFEAIMDDFLVGKRVRVDAKSGLLIEAPAGNLNETDLSSGEYHFLYMMVTALLCLRSGSIIAIDEPELSLHVSWQRRVVSALARCASGAAPLFLFATHSSAIPAEHSDCVKVLSVEDPR